MLNRSKHAPRVIVYLLVFIFLLSPAFALSPELRLTNEIEESRAQKLFLEVRCLVCEGQVIENSDTEFSREMRQLIRKKISSGKSDNKIKSDLVNEFGDDILITPSPKSAYGFLLWLLPIVFAGLFGMFLVTKN